MSYKQTVLRDTPIAFWMLDGQIQDINNFSSHVATTVISPTFQDVAPLVSHSSTDTQINGCLVNSSSSISINNTFGVFQKGYEQKSFGMEFWLLMPQPIDGVCNIINLKSGLANRMQIYTNNDFIYFTLYFSNSSSITTKKQVYSWDSPIHVFASVKDRVMTIQVNGLSDSYSSIPLGYNYYSDTSTAFNIGPASSGVSFTINGLAFYDRILSSNEIKNHMYWAYKDSTPALSSSQDNVSHFLFDDSSGQLIFSKQFINANAYNQGTSLGAISDKTGITLSQTVSPAPSVGTWVYSLIISSYPNFAGVQLTWDSSSYNNSSFSSTTTGRSASVSVSYDNGITYYNVVNGKTFPYFLSNYSSSFFSQCLIKVTLSSNDSSSGPQPRIDNLNIGVYSSINKISDSGLFQISPGSNTTYMIKKGISNIISRTRNLGISFAAQDQGSKPGYAVVSQISSTSYQAIEFWASYRGTGSAILDTGTGTADLYVDSSNILQNTISGSTLYVNGISRSFTPITLTNNEVYHITLVYPSAKTTNILINGSYDVTKISSDATYGYISIYPNSQTLAQIQARYISFLTINTSIGTDSIVYTGNSLVSVGGSVTSLGQLLEYTGTPSQLNAGQAIIYHTHI